jgi:hypothetical protein
MKKKDEIKGLLLRSNEIQDIMGYTPNWTLRYGILIIALIVLFALVGSFFVQIPQDIPINVTIKKQIDIEDYIAQNDGLVVDFSQVNGCSLEEGSVILRYIPRGDTAVQSIASPISGILNLSEPILKGHRFHKGEQLFSILRVPIDSNRVFCYAYLNAELRDNVYVGKEVSIDCSYAQNKDFESTTISAISPLENAKGEFLVEFKLSSKIQKYAYTTARMKLVCPAKIVLAEPLLIEKIWYLIKD